MNRYGLNIMVIGGAVYDALNILSKDEDYINAVKSYHFALGLQNVEPIAEKEGETPYESLVRRVSENPFIYPFLYNGSLDEMAHLYKSALSFKEEQMYSYRYLGIWNILPQKCATRSGRLEYDVELYFVSCVIREWSTEMREQCLFVPIIDRFISVFLECLGNSPYVLRDESGEIETRQKRGYNIHQAMVNEIGDYVAVQRLQFTLRLSREECEAYEDRLIEKYNNLLNIIETLKTN